MTGTCRRRAELGTLLLTMILMSAVQARALAQNDGFDEHDVALVYHKLTGEPLDFESIAQRSDAVRRASSFDRPDVLRAETQRLDARLATASPEREFVLRVNDHISDYDHDAGEFSIGLFIPGYFVPLQAFGRPYQLVFANAEGARRIPMPKEEARAFDARLVRMGRRVTNVIRFRVIGKGDPAGAVTGSNVIRAEILSSELQDARGSVVVRPTVAPIGAVAATTPKELDLARADVAGFRVGVKAADLESSLARLFGKTERRPIARHPFAGIAGKVSVNEMGCHELPGRRTRVEPGAVCVIALVDEDDVVRSIRVERVFAWFDAEILRKALVRKYGDVAFAASGSGYALGWGPEIDPALSYGTRHALTAQYVTNDDFMSRGLNARPKIRVVLQLVDATWASSRKQ